MINTININISGLILNNDMNLNLSETKTEIEGFLSELFKIFLENQKNLDFENITLAPFLPFSIFNTNDNLDFLTEKSEKLPSFLSIPILNPQDMTYLDKVFENMKIQKEGLNSLYELIKSGQMDLNNALESLKITSKDNPISSIIEDLTEKVSINLDKNNIKDIFKTINAQNDNNSLELSSLNLNKESNNKMEISDSIKNNLINMESLKNEKTTVDDIQREKNQKINSENLLPKINLNSVESVQYDNIKQKPEIPVTKLNEISDIIFRATSNSQKTLIVQLEPPELGKILIKLSMDSSGVRADMKVDYPHVKEMLTNLIPEIKSNLQSSGVKISDFLLDLTRDQKGYSDSPYGQGQKKNKDNQKFFEYFA